MLLAALSQPAPELGRRRISWSRGAADRLAEEGGHAVRACLLEPRVELVQHPFAMPDVEVRREVRLERLGDRRDGGLRRLFELLHAHPHA